MKIVGWGKYSPARAVFLARAFCSFFAPLFGQYAQRCRLNLYIY